MQFLNLAKKRRSYRHFRKKSVLRDDLFYLLEAARWAPSANNLQPWRFIVVQEPRHKEKIARYCYRQDWLKNAPILIVVCSLTKYVERQFPKNGDLLAKQSIAAAVQNILLAAEDKGLAACWSAVSAERQIKEVLDIPADVGVHGVVAVGYPLKKEKPTQRIPLCDIIFFENWGSQEVDYVKKLIGEPSKPLLEKRLIKKLKDKAKKFKSAN